MSRKELRHFQDSLWDWGTEDFSWHVSALPGSLRSTLGNEDSSANYYLGLIPNQAREVKQKEFQCGIKECVIKQVTAGAAEARSLWKTLRARKERMPQSCPRRCFVHMSILLNNFAEFYSQGKSSTCTSGTLQPSCAWTVWVLEARGSLR